MSTPQTRLTQSHLAQLAQRHKDVRGQIEGQKASLQSSIDMLVSTNRGEMIQSLKSVHEQWDQACRKIANTLDQMADQVDRTGRETQNQDSEIASAVKQVQTPGLSSFIS